MHRYRSHTCGELRASDVGTDVRLSGWLHNRRDLGGILFIDLRDHYGITQLVARPGTPAYEALDKLTKESTIRVDGRVVSRGTENVNPDLPTGEIEVEVAEVELLGAAAPLPFTINAEDGVNEERRLEYRFLGEFYQLDIEMSFVEQEDVFQPVEKLMTELFEEFGNGRHVTSPFPRIPFREAMLKYGSDKPDLRAQLELVDITDVFEGSEFKAFAGKHVRALPVPAVQDQPRKFFDQLGDFAVSLGAKGLAWVRVGEDGSLSGPIAK